LLKVKTQSALKKIESPFEAGMNSPFRKFKQWNLWSR